MNFVHSVKEPITHSTEVDYAASSVIGLKYKDGIIIASDTNLSYGSMIRFRKINDRIQQITPRTLIGFSGEYSDFQESLRELNEMILSDTLHGRPYLGPKELTHYLSSVHYSKRNDMDPYLNSIIIGGYDWNGELILSSIDSFGTLLKGNYFTTSYSSYFSHAILREEYPEDPSTLTKEKAMDIIKKCFEVLFYRQKTAGDIILFKNLIQKGDNQFACEEETIKLNTKWEFDGYKNFSNEQYYLTC
ncbi:MAG: hypothetical protein MJ252_08060 [archaeon]|nr:hypothetical protein [archaeon]